MKIFKNTIFVIICMMFVFGVTGCGNSASDENVVELTDEIVEKTPEKTKEDKRVMDAIDVLSRAWKKDYKKYDTKDRYLEIINTRIVNIKEEPMGESEFQSINLFEDVDYIVEFELLSNYFGTSPYYFNCGTQNCVVVYKNRKAEVRNNLFNMYRSTTYSTDFSGVIESIEDFHSDYNQVLDLD